MTEIGPYSRPPALAKMDGRTREARLLRDLRRNLVTHVGTPSPAQAMLIEQAAQIRLRLALMDRAFAEKGGQTMHDSHQYLAWANSLSRLLRQLGLKAAPPRAKTLAEVRGQKAA